METMAAFRHTAAKADGSPLEFGECGLCLAASRSHRRGPRWQTEGVENLSGYGGIPTPEDVVEKMLDSGGRRRQG